MLCGALCEPCGRLLVQVCVQRAPARFRLRCSAGCQHRPVWCGRCSIDVLDAAAAALLLAHCSDGVAAVMVCGRVFMDSGHQSGQPAAAH